MGVEDLEPTSPDGSETQDAQASESTEANQSPDSSAEANDDAFDLLSVVRNAADTPDGSDATASSADSENDRSDPNGAAADANAETNQAPDDENFSDVPFHTHPRFKQLVEQRNQYRQGAEQYQQVQEYLRTNGVSPDEAANALQLAALIKTDPAKAWEQLKPIAQQLLTDAGLALPQDLQQRVQSGELTKAAAAEISRLRAGQATADRNAEAQRDRDARSEQARTVQAVQTAVGEWEQSVRASDPDFTAKQDALVREVTYLQRTEGMPSTPEDARKQLQKAYGNVNKQFAPKAPPKPERRPVMGGRAAGGTASAEPGSILDIVRASRGAG